MPNFDKILIAPCGMNCGICYAYLRTKNKCNGCNIENPNKPKYCKECIIKNCDVIQANESGFCFECNVFPCKRLKQLDKRYRTKYAMSMIENLLFIQEQGIEAFLSSENRRWECKSCGGTINVHHKICSKCGKD